jgi:hypothetical protein
MSKFKRSWALMKCSFQVIFENKTLLVFPIILFLLTFVMAVFFLAPVVLWPTGHGLADGAHWQAVARQWTVRGAGGRKIVGLSPAGYVLAAALYLLATCLATFVNVAFYSQILCALRGQPVSVSAGLRLAWSRLGSILVWSLFTGLIGLAIRQLEERVGLLGRWVVGLIGLAWSVASVFAVPIIVVGAEGAHPLKILKSSAATLKKTWGESLLGYLGLQFGGLVVLLGSVVLLGVAVAASIALETAWIIAITAFVWLLGILAFSYLLNVAGQVYRGALYLYAIEGAAPGPFDAEQMNAAWKMKPGGKPAV